MKKLLSVVLCLMLAMSLLAAASAENVVVEAVPNEGQFEGQELSILVSADWMADRYDATIARFEETYGVLYRGEELDYPPGRSTRKPKGQCKRRGIE